MSTLSHLKTTACLTSALILIACSGKSEDTITVPNTPKEVPATPAPVTQTPVTQTPETPVPETPTQTPTNTAPNTPKEVPATPAPETTTQTPTRTVSVPPAPIPVTPPPVTPPPATPSPAPNTNTTIAVSEPVAIGTFSGRSNHITKGGVSIIRKNGEYHLVLDTNFFFDGAPDPVVALGNNGEFKVENKLSALRKDTGGQSYVIPANLNPARFKQAYIWCERFDVPLGIAPLKPISYGS